MDIKFFKDGNEICAYDSEQFINLQESIAGFGKTKEKALINLVKNMNKKIIDLDSQRPHKTSSVICLACLEDWQAVFPATTKINQLECPGCGRFEAVEFDLINSRKIIKILEHMFLNGGDYDTIIKEFKEDE